MHDENKLMEQVDAAMDRQGLLSEEVPEIYDMGAKGRDRRIY